ncbi:MAG: glycosyltransferase family A protein [Desulfuromonadaceae bacterium]|nr:glycosyltransferase family A protein [Desulfuromonadaceae bacterium]MDD2854922.1 glycosyltransferase family A protein [Desulfuromonadaceae bacterium]
MGEMELVSKINVPKVSVIIPCYNHGAFLEETVASVLSQTFQEYEIIIVNDGSDDEATNRLLSNYSKPRTIVIHTENKGVASARNTAIMSAVGKYILPLDADDLIAPTYIEKAVEVLDKQSQTGIVYCLAECFGARQGSWCVPDFSIKGMLFTNLIFCSAMYRKKDWEKVGGYNPNMASGWEDWDFWLSLLELDCGVYRIPEVLFYYRIAEGSRERTLNLEKRIALHRQLMENHSKLFVSQVASLLGFYYRLRDSSPYRLAKKFHITALIGRLLSRKA